MAISSAGCGPLPYRGERVPSRSSPECYLEQIWHNLELRNIACYLKNKIKTNNCKSLISQILKIRFCIKQFHQNVDLTTFPAPVRERETGRRRKSSLRNSHRPLSPPLTRGSAFPSPQPPSWRHCTPAPPSTFHPSISLPLLSDEKEHHRHSPLTFCQTRIS